MKTFPKSVLLILSVLVATSAPAATYTARTWIDLRDALKTVGPNAETLIFIDGTIKTKSKVLFTPTTQGVLRIVGINGWATVEFTDGFDGNWANSNAGNGLEFNNSQVALSGFVIEGFNYGGSAVKMHGKGSLDVRDMKFRHVGNVYRAPRVPKPTSADDAHYTNCIGSHNDAQAVNVRDCEFEDCSTNSWTWAHLVYVGSRTVVVSGCRMRDCGNPFALYGPAGDSLALVYNNRMVATTKQIDASGVARPPYLASTTGGTRLVFVENTIVGEWTSPWTGQPTRGIHLVDDNDYSRMTYQLHWAANTALGVTYDRSAWISMGFDQHSKWPG